MAAFGGKQGGKAAANESKPKQGHASGTADAPAGDKKMGQIHPGHGGSRKGFGA